MRFNYWQDPTITKTPQKGVSDRYLPIRKTPGSSKDLHFDFTEWKEEEGSIQKN